MREIRERGIPSLAVVPLWMAEHAAHTIGNHWQ